MIRVLSYSEVSTALECMARWDFRYGDRLAGWSLKEKAVVPVLSEGRAWGAAVAAWHTSTDRLTAVQDAIAALDASLEKDADRQREHGLYDGDQHRELRNRLVGILMHYTETMKPILMDPVTERELLVPIPSRTGKGGSSRYRLLCYLDATETRPDGVWIEEFKLRGSLTPVDVIANSRQIRWYAWAYREMTGTPVKGVYVNERLNELPKPPRVLASGKLSHAKDQLCTAEAYLAACAEHGMEPVESTLAHLRSRRWQQRVPIMFRDSELDEAGRELVSAAKLIQQLDAGHLYPLRNANRVSCSRCPYKTICADPEPDLIRDLFELRPPKRDLQAGKPAETETSAVSNRLDTTAVAA